MDLGIATPKPVHVKLHKNIRRSRVKGGDVRTGGMRGQCEDQLSHRVLARRLVSVGNSTTGGSWILMDFGLKNVVARHAGMAGKPFRFGHPD